MIVLVFLQDSFWIVLHVFLHLDFFINIFRFLQGGGGGGGWWKPTLSRQNKFDFFMIVLVFLHDCFSISLGLFLDFFRIFLHVFLIWISLSIFSDFFRGEEEGGGGGSQHLGGSRRNQVYFCHDFFGISS